MDTLVVSQVFVAVGTLGLAVAAFASIRSSSKTLRQVSEQLRYQRSQMIPYVSVVKWAIQGNSIHATLKNPTKAMALWVGLHADFFLVEMAKYATQDSQAKRLTEQETREMSLGGHQLFSKYVLSHSWKTQKLMHKGLELERTGLVTFAQSGLDSGVLVPENAAEVVFIPRFGAWSSKTHETHTFNFAELREMLAANNISDVAVSLSLVYTDSAEDPVGNYTLANFGSSIAEAPSLEAAFASHHPVYFIPLGRPEIAGPNMFFEDERYQSLRSHWNRSPME